MLMSRSIIRTILTLYLAIDSTTPIILHLVNTLSLSSNLNILRFRKLLPPNFPILLNILRRIINILLRQLSLGWSINSHFLILILTRNKLIIFIRMWIWMRIRWCKRWWRNMLGNWVSGYLMFLLLFVG